MTAGRPSVYDPDTHPDIANTLAKKGLTNTEIAEELHISPATLYTWQKEHPEFLEAVKKGKESADDMVEKSLFKRALGYLYVEKKIIVFADGSEKIETITKEVVPDTTAQIFWLKNRRPKEWRDKQEVEHSGQITWIELIKSATTPPE